MESTPVPPSTRRCGKCGRTPDVVDFRRDKRTRDGLGAWCKPCSKEYRANYYAANGERERAENAARYEANKVVYLAQQRQHRLANLDTVRARDRARCAGDPVRHARARRWRVDNPERYRANKVAWYQANRDRVVASYTRRRMRMRGPGGRVERISPRAVWTRDRGICQLCARPVALRSMEVDHVKPLARGGSHTFGNVWTSHRHCNRRKHAKELPRWAFASIAPAPAGQLALFAAA